MADITINGASYSDVPIIRIPLTDGSGYATFSEGGGDGGWTWFGKNPVLVNEQNKTILLSDTNYASVTPSTTNQSIYTGTAMSAVAGLIVQDYSYMSVTETLVSLAYTSSSFGYSHFNNECFISCYAFFRRQNGSFIAGGSMTTNSVSTYSMSSYTNAANKKLYIAAATYGVSITNIAPTSANTTTSGKASITLTPKTFNLGVRTHSTYMQQGAWAYVDASKSTIRTRARIFRIEHPTFLSGICEQVTQNAINGDFSNYMG